MTTLEPEQKDILEKLNEIALEANWETVDRADGVPKAVAVIKEAMEEIKRLRELPKEILQYLLDDCVARRPKIRETERGEERIKGATCENELEIIAIKSVAKCKYGVELDENV